MQQAVALPDGTTIQLVSQPANWNSPLILTTPVLTPVAGSVVDGGGDTKHGITILSTDQDGSSTEQPSPNAPSQRSDEEEVSAEEKNAIYNHPLFPLVQLLYGHCETATQTHSCPPSLSVDTDIKKFIQNKQKGSITCQTTDEDLDLLMLKAVQVLRIHILEIEKVSDLCKDFCKRYISCLRSKLQSENLLKIDGLSDGDFSDSETVSSESSTTANPEISSQAMSTLAPGQVISGGTVYQMVQTPQGLVAQPIQLTSLQSTANSSQTSVTSSITMSTDSPKQSNVQISEEEDDFSTSTGKKRGTRRGVLPKKATQIMKAWLFQHIVHPYPSEDEKRQISRQTNLSLLQVNNWFINARRRILQPMLDAGNPELARSRKNSKIGGSASSRTRFWPDNLCKKNGNKNRNEIEEMSTETEEVTVVISGVGEGLDGQSVVQEVEVSSMSPDHESTFNQQQTEASPTKQIILPPGTIIHPDGRIELSTSTTDITVPPSSVDDTSTLQVIKTNESGEPIIIAPNITSTDGSISNEVIIDYSETK